MRVLALAVGLAGGSLGAAAPPPTPLLIDTDMSVHVDDAGALCVAHALADRGVVRLAAVVHSTGLELGAGAISSINHYLSLIHI